MKRQTHQFSLSDTELQDIFDLSGDTARLGSKGKAIRTVLERHKSLLDQYERTAQKLRDLTNTNAK